MDPCDDLVFLFIAYPRLEISTPEQLSINGTVVVDNIRVAQLHIVGPRIPDSSEDSWLQQGWTINHVNINTQEILDGDGDYFNLISTSTEFYTLCGKYLFNGENIYANIPYEGIPNAMAVPDFGCGNATTTPAPTPCEACLPEVPSTPPGNPSFKFDDPLYARVSTINLNKPPQKQINTGVITTTTLKPTTTTTTTPPTTNPPTTTIECFNQCKILKF